MGSQQGSQQPMAMGSYTQGAYTQGYQQGSQQPMGQQAPTLPNQHSLPNLFTCPSILTNHPPSPPKPRTLNPANQHSLPPPSQPS